MTTSMTTLSGIDWNRCPAWIGISVRLRSESLSGIIGIRSRLWIRVSTSDLARWRVVADGCGVPVSTWLRGLADEAAALGRNPDAWRRELAGLARDLGSGVGSNLNQLARHLNEQAKRSQTPDVAAAAASLAAMQDEVTKVIRAADGLLARDGRMGRR